VKLPMKSRIAAVLAVCAAVSLGALGASSVEAAPASKAGKTRTVKTHKTAKHPKTAKSAKTVKAAKRKAAPAKRVELHESDELLLKSTAVVVQDQASGKTLFEKNPDAVLPIASITKLMTAMVVLDAQQPLDEILTVGAEDMDTLRGTRSRLKIGAELSREDMLLLALMASENRAASALSRHYPGGAEAFVAAMNRKAATIGLKDTHFSDPTGLTPANVSSARDLSKMVAAASRYPLIRDLTTTSERTVSVGGREVTFRNTNTLVRSQTPGWEIAVSKTGYIREAGRCLVMQARLNNRPMVIVLLDSWGRQTRIGDANRIKQWVEASAGNGQPSAALNRGAPS